MATPNQGPRIVVGLDYGTTNTALAYLSLDGQTTPSVADVQVFRDWPEGNTQKVPSAYSYSDCICSKRCKQWGHSIDDDSLVMRWTKLELEPRTTLRELEVLRDLAKGLDLVTDLHTQDDASVPRHLSRDAEEVVKDYLSKVSRRWYQDIKSKGQFTLDRVPVDMVVTYPVDWSYEAMNKTYRAVTGAFRKGMYPTLRDIYFSTEPEACALNTILELLAQDRHSLVPGDCFVLCDAGGGTIDLASYKVEQLTPLKLTNVGGISGAKCGATRVDQAFLEWLQLKFVNQISERDVTLAGPLVLKPLGNLLLKRFQNIKYPFDGRLVVDIPHPRNIGGVRVVVRGQQEGIQNGQISLTADEVKSFFEPSIAGTVKLIRQQVAKIQHPPDGSDPGQVTNVFLAGGFAENPYLFSEIKSRYADKTDINLFRATDCWSGVVKGAVLRAVDIGMKLNIKGTACPRNYGICISRRKDRTLDRITWLVREGDLIPSDKGIEATLVGQCRISSLDLFHARLARVVFVATDMVNPPTTLSKIDQNKNEVVYLNVDDIPPVAPQRRSLDVQIRILNEVKVRVKCSGHTLASYDTTL